MNRQEHLKWCKERALVELNAGSTRNAWASMCSDLRKHPETDDHAAVQLGMTLLMSGLLSTPQQMRDFIEGFN